MQKSLLPDMVAPTGSTFLGKACRRENMWQADGPVPSPSRGGGKTHSNSPGSTRARAGRSLRAQTRGQPGCGAAQPAWQSRPLLQRAPGPVRRFTHPAAPACLGPHSRLPAPLPSRRPPSPGCAERRGPPVPRTRAAGPCEGRVREGGGGGRPRPAPKRRPGGAGAPTRAVTELRPRGAATSSSSTVRPAPSAARATALTLPGRRPALPGGAAGTHPLAVLEAPRCSAPRCRHVGAGAARTASVADRAGAATRRRRAGGGRGSPAAGAAFPRPGHGAGAVSSDTAQAGGAGRSRGARAAGGGAPASPGSSAALRPCRGPAGPGPSGRGAGRSWRGWSAAGTRALPGQMCSGTVLLVRADGPAKWPRVGK